ADHRVQPALLARRVGGAQEQPRQDAVHHGQPASAHQAGHGRWRRDRRVPLPVDAGAPAGLSHIWRLPRKICEDRWIGSGQIDSAGEGPHPVRRLPRSAPVRGRRCADQPVETRRAEEIPVQLGLVGLGRMGFNMRERLRAAGHDVVGYDRNQDVSDVASIAEMVEKLNAPRIVWIMVPHGEPTKQTVRELAGLLSAGDLVIEGGNSKYTDDQENAALLAENGIKYVDVGVSGGVWGAKNGY